MIHKLLTLLRSATRSGAIIWRGFNLLLVISRNVAADELLINGYLKVSLHTITHTQTHTHTHTHTHTSTSSFPLAPVHGHVHINSIKEVPSEKGAGGGVDICIFEVKGEQEKQRKRILVLYLPQ
jgi:hypothetical protein